MTLWLISRNEAWDWDEHDAAIIRAETEEQAREIAKQNLVPLGVWQSDRVTCVPLTPDGDAEVVLSSFNAG